MAKYLVENRVVRLPSEDGDFSWTCEQITTLFDVVASNPYKHPYDVLAAEFSWQFDPATYPLRDSPVDLTAEDILLFTLAITNGFPNMPGLQGNCNASQVDCDAMFMTDGLLNPEFEIQYRVLPKVYETFLR